MYPNHLPHPHSPLPNSVETRYGPVQPPQNDEQRYWLFAVYAPYFFIPVLMGYRMLFHPPKSASCQLTYSAAVSQSPSAHQTKKNKKHM